MTEDQAHNAIAKIRSADANGRHAEAYMESMRLLAEIRKLIARAKRNEANQKTPKRLEPA